MDRYSDDYGAVCKDEKGDLVLFDDAQVEIDSRDKRIAELEAQLEAQLAAERHLLVRYMAGVIDSEGESYIEYCRGYAVEFTEGEKAALLAVEPLAIAEMNK